MDNNQNFNNEREPLPTFNAEPDFTAVPNFEAVTASAPEPTPAAPERDPAIDILAGNAFGKGLAAVIMASFPVASIIAIFSGLKGLRYAKDANALAESQGVSVGGKGKAGRILSLIGAIYGGAMTAFWVLYLGLAFLYGFLIGLSSMM